ncbi:phycocyanobilin:ferredoxin oxidoreductase [Pleurocapsa sp. PCC 7319]|uniref:phycocyanobilin:ferredoxin oxidoreductase n=1 Tax=Pleurocapsa sp. PCC 7319 TaxID=118161 RepID=UPI00034C75BD|nr:phycocyanobilin:ferredoxin oxidoreductase [Pleurocapsa sp. PCC 7319]
MVATIRSSLRERQHLLIRQLANCIQRNWEKYLNLSPYNIPEGLGYVEGNLEGEKLIIENHCYQTTQFRKLHLELAQVGDRLDILHCVMFPRSNYDLPIFGVDLVGSKAGIGAAIVDLSPVQSNHNLPPAYERVLANLPQIEFAQPRELPEWGHIFSEFCLFVRPINRAEEILFLDRVEKFLTLHCQIAIAKSLVSSKFKQAQIRAGQRYYCSQQLRNDKTRRVLEKSLGRTWTDRYMSQMLFDCH